jgi:hypothetical protein
MRIPPLYVAITWLYDHTGCSILAIIVLHGTVDFARETLEINRRSEIIFTALWIGFAILLALSFGARNLGHAFRGPIPARRHETGGLRGRFSPGFDHFANSRVCRVGSYIDVP